MRHSSILRLALLLGLLALVIVPVLNAQEEDIRYTVVRGDNLLTIAQRFDAQFECIVANNTLDVNFTLFPDRELLIPAECPPFGTPPLIEGPISEDDLRPGDDLYIVQPRDVLLGIAEGVDRSHVSIAMFSMLENWQLIFPGQQMIIPFDAPPFGITPSLFIYDPSSDTWFPIPAGGAVPLNAGERGYVVQRGDNLDLIAVFFDVRVTCLQARNGLLEDITIFPGDVIVIEGDCPPYNGSSTPLPLRGFVIEAGEGGTPVVIPTTSDISGESQNLQEAFSGGTSTPTPANSPTHQASATATTASTRGATPLVISTSVSATQSAPTMTLQFTATRRPTVTPTPTQSVVIPQATEEAAG